MGDIVNFLIQLNASLQGRGSSVFGMCDNVKDFKMNICIWKNIIKKDVWQNYKIHWKITFNMISGKKRIENPFTVLPEDHFNQLSL